MILQEMMIKEIKETKWAEEFSEGELEAMEDSELLFNYGGIIRHDAWERGYMAGYDAGYELYTAENGGEGMLKVQVETINSNDSTIEGNLA